MNDGRVAICNQGRSAATGPAYDEDRLIASVNRLSAMLGWDTPDRGSLGGVIPAGSKVLIKPNLVHHANGGPWGTEPLVTHPALIRAMAQVALDAGPSQVVVGDAPIQGCDFDALLRSSTLDSWAESKCAEDCRFRGIHDFRRTTCNWIDGVRIADEQRQAMDRFVLFDLADESLLEPVTGERESFRVTCYDPRKLSGTHSKGRHQYLVARDAIDADVVINLPKLKTHKKAGITCALKNLIGINGNKEYLPHHRLGGSGDGGDCYPGSSRIKRALEYALDRQNMAASLPGAKRWGVMANQLQRISGLLGDELGVEGSWQGNDTIWRTCIDLNRILLYGRADGSLAAGPVRRVIHIVDAIVAGQGDGPLSPQPLDLGLVFAGENAPAVDWVSALLMRYTPSDVPLIGNAFAQYSHPLTHLSPDCVEVIGDLGAGRAGDVLGAFDYPVIRPAGWRKGSFNSGR